MTHPHRPSLLWGWCRARLTPQRLHLHKAWGAPIHCPKASSFLSRQTTGRGSNRKSPGLGAGRAGPFTHHSISYLAPLTTLITGEKSGTVMAERLSEWLVALRHQTPRSFRRGRKQRGESWFSQKNDVTQGPSSYPRTSQHTLSIHILPPCAGTGSSRRDPTSGARHRTRLSCSPEGTGDPCSHPTTATREGCTWPWLVTWVPLLTCRAACKTHNGEVTGLWGLQR